MNQPNPYESSNVDQQKQRRSNVVFLVLAGVTVLCMLFVLSLFVGVSRVKTVPIAPPAPTVQPVVGGGNQPASDQ